MKNTVLLFITLLCAGGCTPAPFQETARGPLPAERPQLLIERQQTRTAGRFQLLNSIVFEYNWHAFSGLGYLDIDRSTGLFKVVCLTPMGVKLFELSGDRTTVTNRYTIPAFSRYGDITTVVGNDIRRIYFDVVPSADAQIRTCRHGVRFRQSSPEGTVEYVFSGPEGDLVEKNCYRENGLAWRASYYEYREENGKRLPAGILFLNYEHGYRLTVRQKELLRENDQAGN